MKTLMKTVSLLGALLTFLVLNTGTAAAVGGYSISSGTWNVRSCPATCGVIGTISAGPIGNLVCQVPGPSVTVSGFGTSDVWDLVTLPSGRLGYVSDLAVLQTPYARFDPRLPRCDAQASPAPSTASSTGYSWIHSCVGLISKGRLWACWVLGTASLFIPDPAS